MKYFKMNGVLPLVVCSLMVVLSLGRMAWGGEDKNEDQDPGEMSALMEEIRSPDSVPESRVTNSGAKTELVTAKGFTEFLYEGYSDDGGSIESRKRIINEATAKISEQAVVALVGEGRYKKKKTAIVEKIFKQSGRFIPVIKAGDFLDTPEGKKLSVVLQVNGETLEALLKDQGLMYENEGVKLLIPFVSIDDQIRGGRYSWWKKEKSMLQPLGEYMETQLQKTLFENGFFAHRPEVAQLGSLIPTSYKIETLNVEQVQKICEEWKVPLAMVGDIVIHTNNNNEVVFDFRVSVIQNSTGRSLAQLFRQSRLPRRVRLDTLNFKKDMGFLTQAFKDLAEQMDEALKRGVFSTTLARIEVLGLMPINKFSLFKETLKKTNPSIRQVRERLITSKSVTFEVDINGSLDAIASSLNRFVVGDQTFASKGVSRNNTLQVAPVGL